MSRLTEEALQALETIGSSILVRNISQGYDDIVVMIANINRNSPTRKYKCKRVREGTEVSLWKM